MQTSMSKTYERPFVATLAQRFAAERPLIQVLAGPRQVGKTMGVRQLMAQGLGCTITPMPTMCW